MLSNGAHTGSSGKHVFTHYTLQTRRVYSRRVCESKFTQGNEIIVSVYRKWYSQNVLFLPFSGVNVYECLHLCGPVNNSSSKSLNTDIKFPEEKAWNNMCAVTFCLRHFADMTLNTWTGEHTSHISSSEKGKTGNNRVKKMQALCSVDNTTSFYRLYDVLINQKRHTDTRNLSLSTKNCANTF